MDITGIKFEKEQISDNLYRVVVKKEGEVLIEKYYVGADFDIYRFMLSPVPADLPLLLDFGGNYVIPEKAHIRVFAPIPLEYRAMMVAGGRDEIDIGRVVLWNRKRMYYGKPYDGEFAYFYISGITQNPVSRKDLAYLALDIENKDNNEWMLSRLLIDYNQLSLFLKEEVIYTELVRMLIENGKAELEYTDQAPVNDAELILKGSENARKMGIYRLGKRTLRGLLF